MLNAQHMIAGIVYAKKIAAGGMVGKIGCPWLRSFRRRHPIIGRKGVDIMDMTRAVWPTAENLRHYYFNLYRTYVESGIAVWNPDWN